MDTEDGTFDDNPSGLQERRAERTTGPSLEDDAPQGTFLLFSSQDHYVIWLDWVSSGMYMKDVFYHYYYLVISFSD